MSSDEMAQVLTSMSKQMGVQYKADSNLRKPRRERQAVARKGKSWTLFVNRKGSLCQAIHKTGAVMLLEAPEHLHNLTHKEHALNFFLNNLQMFVKEARHA